ncbi:unnamed protein product [Phaedon cochleariae]|uniref:Protein kinase domain-containing protein n=1 Tax=Phaedon cochleariae TaxID=80249 RepID=A0A9P0GRN6_PHACE|nr:unnamed protein product [Phaedon cochleariae]
MSKKSKKSSLPAAERTTLKICQILGYKIGKIIGKGTYSKVCIARNEQGKILACKIITKRYAGEEFITKFLPRELKIITAIKHPNIVTVHKILELKHTVYIFMDYCKIGDMLEHIRAEGPLAEERAKNIFRQVSEALHHLHNLDIAHRDIKCENIFLVSYNQVKLGDFGFARHCRNKSGEYVLSDTFCGSAAYAAPEILQGMFYDPKMYDIWALGCVLFVMITATMPFDDSDILEMVDEQVNRCICEITYIWTECSSNLKRLQIGLLEPNIHMRLTTNDILKHPWFEQGHQLVNEVRSISISDTC